MYQAAVKRDITEGEKNEWAVQGRVNGRTEGRFCGRHPM